MTRQYLSVLSSGGGGGGGGSDDDQDHDRDGDIPPPPECKQDCISKLSSFTGKVVPLGGPDFTVRRILPIRQQRSVGPFVFLDHFGPVSLEAHAMNVGPHPHIGLMTITYLYEGAILHRDSTGAEQLVLPGQVNGMIAGKGVTHSERGKPQDIQPFLDALSLPMPTGSHGLQIWMALSRQGEDVPPSFHHGSALVLDKFATLVVGQANGQKQTTIPIDPYLGNVLYVDLHFPQAQDAFTLHSVGGDSAGDNEESTSASSLELGIYVSTGKMKFGEGWDEVTGETLEAGNMLVVQIPTSHALLKLKATIEALTSDTRVAILGGTPLPEKRHMYWNFVGTNRDMVDVASKAWEQLDRTRFGKVINELNDDSIPLPNKK